MTKRERYLTKQDRHEELLAIPEWDDENGPCQLLIIEFSGEQRANWGSKITEDRLKAAAEAVIISCHDPETRLPIFEPADRDALNQKSGAVLERIALVALKLSGLLPDAVETAEKNLDVASGDSTSASPKISG